jgi:ABC-type uncharacterized transport system substrate-binding protein
MRRRDFVAVIAGMAALPVAARAQQRTLPVVGFLNSRSAEAIGNRLRGFRRGLEEGGYIEGQTVAIEYRWAENQMARLPDLADDLARGHVDVIVASGGIPGVVAAKAATSMTPIVFLAGQDPVKLGLVSSLSRPGGNLTGVNFFNTELSAKQFELLHEILPAAKRIAVLVDNVVQANTDTTLRDVDDAARASGMKIEVFKANDSREIDAAYEAIAGCLKVFLSNKVHF